MSDDRQCRSVISGKGAHSFSLAALLMLAGMACHRDPPAWHTYQEESVPPPISGSPHTPGATPPAAAVLAWDTPAGWQEDRGGGMRLASFTMGSGTQTGLCTVVELAGQAGGLDANIRRWIEQLGYAQPAPAAWESFIQDQTPLSSAGGLSGMIIDLSPLGEADQAADSMLAAMFTTAQSTVFVKLTGPIPLLHAERGQFETLCRSLRRTP